jgi:Pvc16 N-terminal domain
VIHDLDQSLEVLLKRELASFGRDRVEVSFAAPDDRFTAKPPAVDLFLYDIRENTDLRSNDDVVERTGDREFTRYRPPVRVDASYLITAWPGGGQNHDSSQDEHRLLGAVMTALLRHRSLPREVLRGALADQTLPVPLTVLHPGRLQSLGEFWQALGGKPKAALNYTVTMCIDVFAAQKIHAVVDKEIRVNLSDRPLSSN